jgi:RNA polymerase sigma-70 factor, ECF subfamily
VRRLLAALHAGDVQALLDVLAPDVILIADGGGLAPAVRRPIVGAEKLVSLLLAGLSKATDFAAAPIWLNGAPGVRFDVAGEIATAVSLTVHNGRITRVYAISNPHKLAHLAAPASLARLAP